jgi:hypothetical protein
MHIKICVFYIRTNQTVEMDIELQIRRHHAENSID